MKTVKLITILLLVQTSLQLQAQNRTLYGSNTLYDALYGNPARKHFTDSNTFISFSLPAFAGLGVDWDIRGALKNPLGDIVFVELPRKNIDVEKGVSFGVIESVKAASDIYSPVTGLVVDVNYQLIDHPELINKAPYKAFLIKVEIKDKKELDSLMNDSEYAKYIEGLPK